VKVTRYWLLYYYVTDELADFKVDDVRYLTPKFWRYHQDLINPFDMAAFTLITIQYNLCAGTLAPFLPDRPDLGELMKRILNFDVS
jgi:acyl-CoA oxidase